MTRYIALLSLLVAAAADVSGQSVFIRFANAAADVASTCLPYGGALATGYISSLNGSAVLPGLTPGTYIASTSGPLPNLLGGIQATINGALAPLLAVVVPSDPSGYIQINFQVPLEANASLFSTVSSPNGLVISGGGNTVTTGVPGFPTCGGAFFAANGFAAALHASDSSLVTPQKPAHPGETIIVYADDFFSTWPPSPIGIPVDQPSLFQVTQYPNKYSVGLGYLYLQNYPVLGPCPPPNNSAMCTISATNTPALKVTFEGLAIGKVGVEEIDFVVPANQQPGNWPLFFNLGSCPDGSGVPGTCNATFGASSPYVLLPVD